MDTKLFNAILAMDSYNRGYDQAIFLGEYDGNGQPIEGSDVENVYIGNAKIYADSSVLKDNSSQRLDIPASFYAIAYQMPNDATWGGRTIISYRGTDSATDGLAYPIGGGYTTGIDQAYMSFQFYNAVAASLNGNIPIDPRSANISLTGHSLGGGLAGLVGALYMQNGVLFDNMPFEASAQSTILSTDPKYIASVYQGNMPWAAQYGPTSDMHTYSLDGEFLSWSRPFQQTPETPYSLPGDPNIVAALPDSLDLHSMASLVIHMFSITEIGGATDWQAASPYFWPVLYQDDFAQNIGAGDAGTLRTKLAYSAIPQEMDTSGNITSVTVFGDTGIRAFYNDANDLGSALSSASLLSNLAIHAEDISKAFIQYAGELALNKVVLNTEDYSNGAVLDGVLSYAGNVLTVDFSDQTWGLIGAAHNVTPQYFLIDGVFEGRGDSYIRDVMQNLWGTPFSNIFEKVSFAATESGSFYLSDPASSDKAQMFVGYGFEFGTTNITGSSGRDMIWGGSGSDELFGGGQNDIFIASRANDHIYGQSGIDAVIYSGYQHGITMSGTTVTKSDGTDFLSEVEYVVLTGYSDTVNLSEMGGLMVLDGGDGTDTLTTITEVYDMQGGHLYNYGFSEELTIKSFETVNVTSNYILPDENIDLTYQSNGTIVSSKGVITLSGGVMSGVTVDYRSASGSAEFFLSNFLTNNSGNDTVRINGHTHTYGVTNFAQSYGDYGYIGTVYGTNKGDTVRIQNVAPATIGYSITTFISGSGDDIVYASTSTKSLIYGYNGGNDVIYGGSGLNRIVLDASIAFSDVTTSLVSSKLILTIANHGTLTVNNFDVSAKIWFSGNGYMDMGLGGVYLNQIYYNPDYIPLGEKLEGGPSANLISGIANWDETISGYAGDDDLRGNGGVDNISGGTGNDILAGGTGNDSLDGGQGDDVYRYSLGDGSDVIRESLFGYDTIKLDASIQKSQVGFSINPDNLTDLAIKMPDGQTITVMNQYMADNSAAVEKIVFSNGEVVDLLRGLPFVGSAAHETVYGTSFDDTLTGLQGNDQLRGGAGNDTYIFNSGDSSSTDTIFDENGVDTIQFNADVSKASVWFENGGSFLYLHYGASDVINISNESLQNMIERIKFSDGSVIDLLSGLPINGTSGNDNISGTAMADIISGGAGNDTINGGDGNDTVDGGTGNDVMDGGTGIDTLSYASAASAVTVSLNYGWPTAYNTVGAGSDIYINFENLTGSDFADTLEGNLVSNVIDGGKGNDLIKSWVISGKTDVFTGGEGNDTLSYAGQAASVTVNLSLSSQQLAATGMYITVNGIENLVGTNGNDTLIGDNLANIIQGGLGTDIMVGGDGIDTLSYTASTAAITMNLGVTTAQNTVGAGSDTVSGFENLLGSGYNDTLTGDGSVNNIDGGSGNDVIDGGSGDDILAGGLGTDTLSYKTATSAVTISLAGSGTQNTLGAGVDTFSGFENLLGSGYNDTLTGDGNANTIEGGIGNDILNGGLGVDTASYSGALSAVTVSLAVTAAQNTVGAGTDTLSGFENLLGSGYNDTLTGDAASNVIDGGAGNDTLSGGLGNDTLIGGAGTDAASYSSATAGVTVSLAITTAQNTVNAGSDTLSGIENLIGSGYNDTLTGDSNVNTIDGGAGNDTINSGDGNDVVNGGAGDDILSGGNGIDTVTYASSSAAVTVKLSQTTAQNTIGYGTDTLSGFENLVGSGYNDTLTGDSNANTIDGGSGNDVIDGGAGNDVLIGGAGTDQLSYASATAGVTVNLATTTAQNTVGAGTDTISGFEDIFGSAFNDTLTGDGNANTIEGGLGNDILNGGAGTDTVSYASATSAVTVSLATTAAQNTIGAGTDTLSNFENILGSNYNDNLFGNASANRLTGGLGDDYLYGSAGADVMDGGSGFDTVSYMASTAAVNVNLATNTHTGGDAAGDSLLGIESVVGSSYNDTIRGSTANESLYGGSGVDTLYGGTGNDVLVGGAGADVLWGETGADTFKFDVASAGSIDTVKDFKLAESDKIDIKDLLIGYDAVTKAITDYIECTTSGANTIVKVDRDGLGTAYTWQQVATFENVTGLTDEAALKSSGTIIA